MGVRGRVQITQSVLEALWKALVFPQPGRQCSGSVAEQMLLIDADRYTPAGPDQIPTGEITDVTGTPFDFCQMTSISARLNSAHQQMLYASTATTTISC
jgi:hypothetical protein